MPPSEFSSPLENNVFCAENHAICPHDRQIEQVVVAMNEGSPSVLPARASTSPLSPSQCALEMVVLVLLLFLFAGGEPSATDESHYLSKAKHYWNPAWCPNDYFLNSTDAHVGFYWTFGLLANLFSLPTAAWIGRMIVWTFQAFAWQRLSVAVIPKAWFSLLSMGLFLALARHTYMAREWAIGDVEGKCVAYGFVFLGLAQMIRGHWSWTWIWFGAGAAFHVLVGGWAVVAGFFAWAVLQWMSDRAERPPNFMRMVPGILLGGVLSLPGLLPSLWLNHGTSPQITAEGNIAYVYVRLSHHLVFHRFETWLVVRHMLVVFVSLVFAWRYWKVENLRPLLAINLGAIVLMVVGIVLDYSTNYLSNETSAAVLRFYWYRLCDVMTPLVVAFALCHLMLAIFAADSALRSERPKSLSVAGPALLVFLTLISVANIGWIIYRRIELGVPESQKTLVAYEPNRQARRATHRDWLECCEWIRAKTPIEAIFLTPQSQQTFKWYAQRGEVFTWKDAPQDGAGMTEWLRRYQDVMHPNEVILHSPETDPSLPVDQRANALAKKYGATYIVVDRRRGWTPQGFPLVYPRGNEFNATFAVYRLIDQKREQAKP